MLDHVAQGIVMFDAGHRLVAWNNQLTLDMIYADTQPLLASDWPHFDFDLPSEITDLPFLSDQTKRNILGLNAGRIFDLDPTPVKQL